MSIKVSDQPGEHDAGAVKEIALAVGMNNLKDNIQRSYHNINSDYISL
jgi:hypothetical protein